MRKLNFTPLLVAGAVASLIGAAPIAAANATSIATIPQTGVQFVPADDPGGGGCVNGHPQVLIIAPDRA
jgi:hypothetical protein